MKLILKDRLSVGPSKADTDGKHKIYGGHNIDNAIK